MAPDGYTITTNTTFSIDETGKVTSTGTVSEDGVLLVEDAKTHVEVSKVDIADGEELEGAEIQILKAIAEGEQQDENKDYVEIEGKTYEVVEKWTSTKEAHVIEGLLTDTDYILRETVAPDGYTITTNTTFSIDVLTISCVRLWLRTDTPSLRIRPSRSMKPVKSPARARSVKTVCCWLKMPRLTLK